MQKSQLLLQNFEFHPPELTILCPHRLEIKIGKNRSDRGLYVNDSRFFVIGINDDVESDPLYENDTFIHDITDSGLYVVACLNSGKARCRVVATDTPNPIVETFEIVERSPPQRKPRVPSPTDRPFKISPSDMVLE
jgi:hypothetical protein